MFDQLSTTTTTPPQVLESYIGLGLSINVWPVKHHYHHPTSSIGIMYWVSSVHRCLKIKHHYHHPTSNIGIMYWVRSVHQCLTNQAPLVPPHLVLGISDPTWILMYYIMKPNIILILYMTTWPRGNFMRERRTILTSNGSDTIASLALSAKDAIVLMVLVKGFSSGSPFYWTGGFNPTP